MEIIIGKGLNISSTEQIRFGQIEAEIEKVLGAPDKTYAHGVDNPQHWQYFALQIELVFKGKHENRLSWIEVKKSDAALFGQQLIGTELKLNLSLFERESSGEAKHEDYGSFDSYFYEKQWMELQFALNCLKLIKFGFLWLDNETPNWP